MDRFAFSGTLGAAAAFALAAALTPHAAGQCVGDINQDGIVDGGDLALVIAAWNTNDPLADLDGTGLVDGRDIGFLLAQWGPCLPPLDGPEYELELSAVPAVVTTNAGAQLVASNVAFTVMIGAPDGNGICRLGLSRFTIDYSTAAVVGSETGGMDMQFSPQSPEGTWDLTTGQFSVPLLLDTHSWLIDQQVPRTEAGCEEDGGYDDDVALERWEGLLTGFAPPPQSWPPPEVLYIDYGGGTFWPKTSIAPAVQRGSFFCGAPTPVRKKPLDPLLLCPDDLKSTKKKVCIQPIFIGTDGGANNTGTSFAAQKAKADDLWKKCCVEFEWKAPKFIDKAAYRKIKFATRDDMEKEANADPKGEDDCIEVFFVEQMLNADDKRHDSGDGTTRGSGTKAAKIWVSDDAVANCDPKADTVLAHELGHAIGNCLHNDAKPAAAGTIMAPTGKDPPTCPGVNVLKVKKVQCEKVRKGPLAKDKNPEEPCCLSPD